MESARAASVFSRLLRDAAAAVTGEYIALPRHLPDSTEAAESYLERVYCYELYHQMRVMMDVADGDDLDKAVAEGWRVNGEVVKATSYIPGSQVPDFIWHVPGKTENGHVVEVKRSRASVAEIKADVHKLAEFRLASGYRWATLLIVGTHVGSPGRLRSVLLAAKVADVEVLFHRGYTLPLTVA